MEKEELINLYDKMDILGKWQLIKKAMNQDITEICPLDSLEFSCFANKQKTEAMQNKQFFRLVWHYWLRKIPLLAPMLGRKYLPSKREEYYRYKTWYYEYLEPVIDIRDNFVNYEKVFGLLADEKSKVVYCDVLMARMTGNDKYYLAAYNESKAYPQYFDLDILPQPDQEGVFADCGGYIGDTAENYIKCYSQKYKRIYVYEPDPQNASQAKEDLKKYHDICIKQCGVGKENKTVYFAAMGNASSSIQKKGTEIQVISLDNDISEPITFIKMDIEGEESNAIWGGYTI